MSEKCSKCGASEGWRHEGVIHYICGNHTGSGARSDYICVARQLAAVTAERDEARKRAEIAEEEVKTDE